MTAGTALRPQAPEHPGRTALGIVTINDRVVEKIAALAAAEIPDVGGPAGRIFGRAMTGAGPLGGAQASLGSLPKVSADVDGSVVVLGLSLSVRWRAPVPDVTSAVRRHVRDRVTELTGLTVTEVSISVTDLVTHLPGPPRVR